MLVTGARDYSKVQVAIDHGQVFYTQAVLCRSHQTWPCVW